MTSSSSNGSANRRTRQVRIRCDCGDLLGKWTAWTPKNPGRRFKGCPNDKDIERDCGFFYWVDPALPNNYYTYLMLELHDLRNGANGENLQAVVPEENVGLENGGGVEHEKLKIAIVIGLMMVLVFWMM